MKKLKGFLIDPEAKTIKEVTYNGDYKEISKMLGCDLYTIVTIDDQNHLFVDDEGLLNDPKYFFRLKGYPQPLAGRGLILGYDESGETIESSMELDEVKALIPEFLSLKVLGWETTEDRNAEIMPGIKGFRITNRPILARRKDVCGND